jgi:hypothetical protein
MAANRMRISLSFEAETDLTKAEAEKFYASTAEWLRSATGIAWTLEVTVLIDRDGRANNPHVPKSPSGLVDKASICPLRYVEHRIPPFASFRR